MRSQEAWLLLVQDQTSRSIAVQNAELTDPMKPWILSPRLVTRLHV